MEYLDFLKNCEKTANDIRAVLKISSQPAIGSPSNDSPLSGVVATNKERQTAKQTMRKKRTADETQKQQTQRKAGSSKYEAPVQAIIDLNIQDVVEGKAEPLTREEIAKKLKKEWEGFKAKVSSIVRRIGETLAWENYDKDLNKAWREAELGETYTKRKKGGKRRNRKNMEPFADV